MDAQFENKESLNKRNAILALFSDILLKAMLLMGSCCTILL